MNLRAGFQDIKEVYDLCHKVQTMIRSELFGQVYGVFEGGAFIQNDGFPTGFLDVFEYLLNQLTYGNCPGWCKHVRYSCLEKMEDRLQILDDRNMFLNDSDLVFSLNAEAMDVLEKEFQKFIKANIFYIRYSEGLFKHAPLHRLSVWTRDELQERMLAFCMGGSMRLGQKSFVQTLGGDEIDLVCVQFLKALSIPKIERYLLS